MLITVNLIFISLAAPIVIFLTIYEYVQDDNNNYRHAVIVLIKIFHIILMNLKHSVNIIIYSLTLREFRSEMSYFLHVFQYCIIEKLTNPTDLSYVYDDGILLLRIRRFRYNLLKCCRIKIHSNSSNTTNSSGLQLTKRNENEKYSIVPTSETLTNKNNRPLTLRIYEVEDVSFYSLSKSIEF